MLKKELILRIVFSVILGVNISFAYGQYDAKMDHIDSIFVSNIKDYEKSVRILKRNEKIIIQDFNKEGLALYADKHKLDSLAIHYKDFSLITKMLEDSLLLNESKAIQIVFNRDIMSVIFFLRVKQIKRFDRYVDSYCVLEFIGKKNKIEDGNNWESSTEQRTFHINPDWDYSFFVK